MTDRGITPSQTVGPFFAFALTPGTSCRYTAIARRNLVTEDTAGQVIEISGRVTDGEGNPVPDALIEIWQADGDGRYPGRDSGANTGFTGFGRSDTVDEGRFAFTTVKPGVVPGPDGKPQAPHINLGVFARGVVRRMFTRIYFEDEPSTATDPILGLVPADRRATLIARRTGGADGRPRYLFNLRLQGEGETVFFEA